MNEFPSLFALVADYEAKQAAAVAMRKAVDTVAAWVLMIGHYTSAEDGKVILEPNEAHKMDWSQLKCYLTKVNTLLIERGMKSPDNYFEICPARRAECEALAAKKKLARAFEVVAKMDKPITSAAALDKVANLICVCVHAIEEEE
jgi:hypothetical protein